MIIKELNLKNFGKFSEQSFSFEKGLNVVYGPNEAGKTTIYTAIGALLFGLEKQRGRAARTDTYTVCQPWENKTWYEGSMRFETGGKVFLLERTFYQPEKSSRLVCETDGEELSVEQGDLKMLLGDTDAELFFQTVSVGQMKMKPGEGVYDHLKNYIAGQQEEGSRSVDVVAALEILEKKKKELEQQKKKCNLEIRQLIEKSETKIEMVEKEILVCQNQLEALKEQEGSRQETPSVKKRGFFCRLLQWVKRLLFRKRFLEEQRKQQEEELSFVQKKQFLQELSGEKESLKEELLYEREQLYEKLWEQSGEEEIKALELAMERIRQVASGCREEIVEKLQKKASTVLSEMTGGRYKKLFLEENGEISLWDGHYRLRLFQVSAGCRDQAYLSLRIGLLDLLFEEEELPLIFDDAFVYFDEKRLQQFLSYLTGLHRQVILFTCHQREMQILEQMGEFYHKILL